jgi:hypothetical protein
VSQEHLKRYLCEFDFRYNYRVALGFTDMQRTEIAAAGIWYLWQASDLSADS